MNGLIAMTTDAGNTFTVDTTAVTEAFGSGLQTVANNMISIGTMAVPIIIGVCGFFAIVKFGPKIVKMLKG